MLQPLQYTLYILVIMSIRWMLLILINCGGIVFAGPTTFQ
jgi:hypothetical protein